MQCQDKFCECLHTSESFQPFHLLRHSNSGRRHKSGLGWWDISICRWRVPDVQCLRQIIWDAETAGETPDQKEALGVRQIEIHINSLTRPSIWGVWLKALHIPLFFYQSLNAIFEKQNRKSLIDKNNHRTSYQADLTWISIGAETNSQSDLLGFWQSQ